MCPGEKVQWSLEGEAWWTWGVMLSRSSLGILALILPGPALQGGEWLLLLGLRWLRGLSRRAGWDGHLGSAMQGCVVSSPAAVLQGSALMHFYLLEEARAVEPAPSLGARSAAGARWSSRTSTRFMAGQETVSLQGASWPSAGRRGLGRGTCRSGGCLEARETGQLAAEGLSSSSLSTAVHAEEQTVKGEETRLGAFLGAGGVGG